MVILVTAVLLAFVLTVIGEKKAIPVLHRMKFGQQVRDDGPQSHLKKQGTPTMGGIVFVAVIVLVSLIFLKGHLRALPVILMTAGFGAIGFADDYLKIRKHKSEGLKAKQKLLLQAAMTALFCLYLMVFTPEGTMIRLPFTGAVWHMGWLFVPAVFLVVLGTDNGVNFTDGEDGLCATVTMPVAVFFLMLSTGYNSGIEIVCAAVLGCMMGFLVFNAYPAKVFMGDTGSLALGGFVASSAMMTRQPLMILLVGFIYLIEVISVIIQVLYFKKTGGKRFFKMAPLHHHFELSGWSETRVVSVFTSVTIMLCLIAWMGI